MYFIFYLLFFALQGSQFRPGLFTIVYLIIYHFNNVYVKHTLEGESFCQAGQRHNAVLFIRGHVAVIFKDILRTFLKDKHNTFKEARFKLLLK